jgi:uncharacterized protein YbaP (TraB family)
LKMASGEWRVANEAPANLLFAIRHSLFALAVLVLAAPATAQVQIATIAAHPALWTVHSKTATVYLFGSIHLLPANVVWHTPEIDRAMDSASTFMFEAPLDDAGKAQVAQFIREHGTRTRHAAARHDAAFAAARENARRLPARIDGRRSRSRTTG